MHFIIDELINKLNNKLINEINNKLINELKIDILRAELDTSFNFSLAHCVNEPSSSSSFISGKSLEMDTNTCQLVLVDDNCVPIKQM